jgi:hypothetical protein
MRKMAHKETVIIGRFTKDDAEEFEVHTGRDIYPVVATREEARKQAILIGTQESADNEHAVSARLKEETNAGWVFVVTIDNK